MKSENSSSRSSRFKYGDYKDPKNPWFKKIPYLLRFLNKKSASSRVKYFLEVLNLNDYLMTHHSKTVLEAESTELLDYLLDVIDHKSMKKQSKENAKHYIASFYRYVEKYKTQIEKEKYFNPMPSSELFSFKANPIDFEMERLDQELMTHETIEKVLHHVYFTQEYWKFIFISLITYTGARITEIASVRLKFLDLEERWFTNRVKSRFPDKRLGIFFIPEFFVQELEEYIEKEVYTKRNPHSKTQIPSYLFPGIRNINAHVSVRTVQQCLLKIQKALGLNKKINSHAFRNFLNSKRTGMGCSETMLKRLINQKVQDVNPAHYQKEYETRIYLRDAYDTFCPFKKLIKPKLEL